MPVAGRLADLLRTLFLWKPLQPGEPRLPSIPRDDSEGAVDELIKHQADLIGHMRGEAAESRAQTMLLEADMERNLNLAREWSNKLELAVSRGADDLLRQNFYRKVDYEVNASYYKQLLVAQQKREQRTRRRLIETEELYEDLVRGRERIVSARRRLLTQTRSLKLTTKATDPAFAAGLEDKLEAERLRIRGEIQSLIDEYERRRAATLNSVLSQSVGSDQGDAPPIVRMDVQRTAQLGANALILDRDLAQARIQSLGDVRSGRCALP
jgi:hypothetical protein